MQFKAERDQERARRLITALLSNLDAWISDLDAVERECCPGRRGRLLHLQRNMAQARNALINLSSEP